MSFSRLTDFLHHLVDEVHIPSTCMQVYKDGVQVYSHSYGTPEGMETVFESFLGILM